MDVAGYHVKYGVQIEGHCLGTRRNKRVSADRGRLAYFERKRLLFCASDRSILRAATPTYHSGNGLLHPLEI